MATYQRRIQQLRVRMAMSAVLFLGFLAAAASAGRIEGDVTGSKLGMMLLLLIGAMLLLPRSAMPSGPVKKASSEEEQDVQFVQRSKLKRMAQYAFYIRLLYLGLALFVLFAAPRLFGGLLG